MDGRVFGGQVSLNLQLHARGGLSSRVSSLLSGFLKVRVGSSTCPAGYFPPQDGVREPLLRNQTRYSFSSCAIQRKELVQFTQGQAVPRRAHSAALECSATKAHLLSFYQIDRCHYTKSRDGDRAS